MKSLKKILTNGLITLSLLPFLSACQKELTLDPIEVKQFLEIEVLAHQHESENENLATDQFILGAYYSEGKGVTKDTVEALKWFESAGDKGNKYAQHFAGQIYYEGKDHYQDFFEAYKWHKKAADQGHWESQVILGDMYSEGKGVKQNKTVAKRWYGKSCDNEWQDGCDSYRELNEQGY